MKQRLHPLCVALLALVLCNTPLFAEDFEVDGIYYNFTSSWDNTVEVTYRGSSYDSYSNEYSGAVTIPESVTYDGNTFSVTSIRYLAFYKCSNLTSVEIPNSVTSIGDETFDECSSLTSVVIPNSVTSIGHSAFSGCSSLTSVVIPNSVTSIGHSAFSGCSSLTSVVIPNSVTSIGDGVFASCSSLTSVEIPNSVTSIGDWAFASCSSLTSVEIPNSVTSIGDWAFASCSSLTSVVIPNSVTSIGDEAFYHCSSLTSVEIPNSVTSIGSHAFYMCSSLTSVVIPNSVTSIGDEAFYFCSNLRVVLNNSNLTFTKGSSSYGYIAYYANVVCNGYEQVDDFIFTEEDHANYLRVYIGNATELVLPTNYKGGNYGIGDYAFYYCKGLTSVEIPNSVTSIGNYAFESCSGLTSVVIPNSVTSIGNYAFEYCSSLTSVVIPNNVTSIGEAAFGFCSSLTSVEIPNSVTSIGEVAFYSCSSLTSVEIPNSVTSIGEAAFGFCSSLTSVVIPNSVISIGNYAFDNCSSLTSVEIPNSVTSIGPGAFRSCSGLISVEIPNSVTSIGDYAFSGCSSLTSVEIPNSVTSIGSWAFYNCSSLTSVEIPNSVTSIRSGAFRSCSGLTSVEIPNSVTSIWEWAFEYCSSLTSVVIPNSVTSIGDDAFRYCSSLTTATVGCSWITNPLYEFDENVTVNATLHSYENGVCTVCGEASEDEGERIELVEGTPFENEEAREVAQVTYNRTLPNLKWNALYLPVEIPVSELRDNYDVAYFNNMHAYDRNNDGTVDEMDMEIFFITEGTLHANHPYFIRAKNNAAKQMNLVLTNVTLHSTEAANCTSITTSSAYMNFKLKGVYKRIYVSSTNIPVNPNPEAPISNDYDSDESIYGCYAITASGAWSPIAVGSYLNPFRLYLKMTDRDGTPVKMDQALQTIRIRVHGEDGTTDIEEHCINGQQSTTIYDLQGRRVMVPQKGKIYIVGGKKKVF